MRRILDFYFRFPLSIDYFLGSIIVMIVHQFTIRKILKIPNDTVILDFASETTTVILTLAGFILTFLTLLITFKSEPKGTKDRLSLMEIFCRSTLYKETLVLLKNGIKSLVFSALIIYILRLIIRAEKWDKIFGLFSSNN